MNKKHFNKLREGVESWNKWRNENPDEKPDLSGVFFNEINLSGADLCRTDLSHAYLCKADFSKADLYEANLNYASLCSANFKGASLVNAKLILAYLMKANFNYADLSGANFSKAFCNFSLQLNHFNYPIIAINDHFQIGCLSKNFDYFANMTQKTAYELDGIDGVLFFQRDLPKILKIYRILREE